MNRFTPAIVFVFVCLATAVIADPYSGPGRQTLLRESWGTVFFDPSELEGDYELEVNKTGEVQNLKTAAGAISIHESVSDVRVEWPDFKARVDHEPNGLTLHWGEQNHHFSRESNRLTYEGPTGKVTFTKEAARLTIDGPRGTTTISEQEGNYTITSPAGETHYETTPSGFRVSGVRLLQHPYLKRGALFVHRGVGIYVELALLDPNNPLFKHLEWNTIVEVR